MAVKGLKMGTPGLLSQETTSFHASKCRYKLEVSSREIEKERYNYSDTSQTDLVMTTMDIISEDSPTDLLMTARIIS